MEHCNWSDETICGHFGEEQAAPMHAVVPPLYLNSLHTYDRIEDMLEGRPEGQENFTYGRVNNPTTDLFERKIAALERGAGALAFASGMAAITTSILACVRPGGHVVCVANSYGSTRAFLKDQLSVSQGIQTTFVRGDDFAEIAAAVRENTQLIYLESPSTMLFHLQDIRAVTELARSRGIKTAIDNTWSTPLYQKPLTMGMDISIHTISKYIGGHSDVIGGVAAFADQALLDHVRGVERLTLGGILGPFEAWLAIRGLRTLPVRMAAHQKSALLIAKRLEEHPKVAQVNYPGLPSHPQYELGRRQMTGYSGLMTFAPKANAEDCRAFFNGLKLFRMGVSWGGFESLALFGMYRATDEMIAEMGGSRNLIRIAVGLEDVEELWRDLEEGLDRIPG